MLQARIVLQESVVEGVVGLAVCIAGGGKPQAGPEHILQHFPYAGAAEFVVAAEVFLGVVTTQKDDIFFEAGSKAIGANIVIGSHITDHAVDVFMELVCLAL